MEYLDKNKVYAIMTKLTNLSYSQLIPINSDEFKKLHEITSDVRDLLDYPIEQKAKWNKEDYWMLECIIEELYDTTKSGEMDDEYPDQVEKQIKWLKSLRPQSNTVSIKDATK